MYNATNKYYAGLEFDIRAFSNVYFGLGLNLSSNGYFSVNVRNAGILKNRENY
ncbi:MAG: hypothetical protein LBD46_01560 [Endomicrobium sp.]|jgi:hypothetical protein|nr:hypothetical protein [Endomicrobium sp.]